MTIKELRQLSDEELREISLQKNSRGCATSDANKAQSVRQERSGYWPGIPHKGISQEATLAQEKGTNGFVKKFK